MTISVGTTIPIQSFVLGHGFVFLKGSHNDPALGTVFAGVFELAGADGSVMGVEVDVQEVAVDGNYTGIVAPISSWSPPAWCQVYGSKGLSAALSLMVAK